MKIKNLLIASIVSTGLLVPASQAILDPTQDGMLVPIRPDNPDGPGAVFPDGTYEIVTPPIPNPFGPPNTLGRDNWESDNLIGLNELQNILVPLGGLIPDLINLAVFPGGVIPAGTIVASHGLNFDPEARDNPSEVGPTILGKTLAGTAGDGETVVINFDAVVVGIFRDTASINASDFLANPGVNYDTSSSDRGLEGADTIEMAGNTVVIDRWAASTPGDFIRILTLQSPGGPPPPVPDTGATILLLGLGLATLGLARHRSKKG